jgi:hypothetical protein
VEKYGTAVQVTDDSMAHAHCMLNNKHTLRMCDTAFELQQWLQESASMLRYSACIVKVNNCRADRSLLLFAPGFITAGMPACEVNTADYSFPDCVSWLGN